MSLHVNQSVQNYGNKTKSICSEWPMKDTLIICQICCICSLSVPEWQNLSPDNRLTTKLRWKTHYEKRIFFASVLVTLILLAFLLYTVLEHIDKCYQMLRPAIPSRDIFFGDTVALTRYVCVKGCGTWWILCSRGIKSYSWKLAAGREHNENCCV